MRRALWVIGGNSRHPLRFLANSRRLLGAEAAQPFVEKKHSIRLIVPLGVLGVGVSAALFWWFYREEDPSRPRALSPSWKVRVCLVGLPLLPANNLFSSTAAAGLFFLSRDRRFLRGCGKQDIKLTLSIEDSTVALVNRGAIAQLGRNLDDLMEKVKEENTGRVPPTLVNLICCVSSLARSC